MKKKLFLFLIFLLSFYGGILIFKKYYQIGINESNSINGTAFLINKNNIDIFDKEYLVFLYDARNYHNYKRGKKFIKKVVCKPGDKLSFKNMHHYYNYFCNDKFIAKAYKRDSKNKLLQHNTFIGKIPKDNYFVVGSHDKSFDSRYWGFVNKNQIIGGARKLW